jgi:hypothetical protein
VAAGGPSGPSGSADALFSREEVQGGLPARRAQTLLFLVESRTAHLVARSRQLLEPFVGERAERERDLAFVDAFRFGRAPPLRPTIQDLEHHAPTWAALVSENPQLRAAVAHLLGQKYVFARQDVPHIAAALGLDAPAVENAYERLYRQPLSAIYAPRLAASDRWRWSWATLSGWVIGLPPFWFAVAFTLALGIPQAMLAVPIAAAAVGPLPSIGLTLVAALVSCLTVTSVAEAAARSGVVRYGSAYTGRLAVDYLGVSGGVLFTVALFVLFLLSVLASLIALSVTLTAALPLTATVWAGLLFAAGAYLLARGSASFSIAVLVAIAALIVVLTMSILLLTVSHFRVDYMLEVDALLSSDLEASLHNTIGVILMLFFGEAFVVQCAKAVLPRDPGGRSLIWGSLAGLAIVAALLCVWLLVVNGSLTPSLLLGQTGTVIGPLGTIAGPAVTTLGVPLAALLIGLAGLRCMVGAYNVTREWLPAGNLSTGARVLLALSPLAFIFLAAEWMLSKGTYSFAGVIRMLGVLSSTIFSGAVPVLLLVASRRKGEVVPGVVLPFLGHPLVVGGIYVLYLGILLLHGLVLWQAPVERAAALLTAALVVIATVLMVRGGAFTRRIVVELREDLRQGHQSTFAVTASGQATVAEARLTYPDGEICRRAASEEVRSFTRLRQIAFDLPATTARELKVWVHRVTPDGSSEPLPTRVVVTQGERTRQLDLATSGGQALLPLTAAECSVTLILDPGSPEPAAVSGVATTDGERLGAES